MNKLIKILIVVGMLASPAFAQKKMSETGYGAQNNIINGNWDFWQRATSMTQATVTTFGTGYGVGAADRWYINWNVIPTAFTFSRQSATPGELAGEPTYYARMAVTTIGSGSGIRIEQHIESARSFAGKPITLSFWGKNTVSVQPIIDIQQVFGAGGSPSSAVTMTCATLPAMTTSWVKYSATCTVPSISGKTFGTTAGTDYFNIRIKMTDVNQQFDIAQVMLNVGDRAAPFALAGGDVHGELAKSQRYYESATNWCAVGAMRASGSVLEELNASFKVSKRSNTYTATFSGMAYTTAAGGATSLGAPSVSIKDYNFMEFRWTSGTPALGWGSAVQVCGNWSVDAEF